MDFQMPQWMITTPMMLCWLFGINNAHDSLELSWSGMPESIVSIGDLAITRSFEA
jgi:hypothetical protein